MNSDDRYTQHIINVLFSKLQNAEKENILLLARATTQEEILKQNDIELGTLKQQIKNLEMTPKKAESEGQ